MKLNKSSFKYLFVCLLSVATLTAQTVSGTVSSADGNALSGANVMVEGTDMGASSNNDGSFSISGLSDGDYTLTASYIGYDSASVVVSVSGGQATIGLDSVQQHAASIEEGQTKIAWKLCQIT